MHVIYAYQKEVNGYDDSNDDNTQRRYAERLRRAQGAQVCRRRSRAAGTRSGFLGSKVRRIDISFAAHVSELRDEALAKQKKSSESYQRACMSIEACPVQYARPRDLICLRGVGDKTIKILETRWDKWLIGHPEDARSRGALTGREISDSTPLTTASSAPASTNAKASSSKRPTGKSKAQQAKAGLSSDSELEHSDPSLFPAPARKKQRKTATYIPAPRSGGYGILMALVLAIEEPWRTTTVFQSRDEIVRVAQKWCNSSYDKGEKNAWMTAWNSVKTLVNRGYVYERGRPANFCLTEEG
jgi:crossover junction endonuclease MUS81